MKKLIASALLACTLVSTPSVAQPGTFPDRPVTLVVPVPPGGPTDTIARILARHIALGQPIVVENRAGAGGSVGGAAVARARPDGHTIGIGLIGTHVFLPVIANLPYDVVNDFTPVAMVTVSPQFIVSNPSVPARNLTELVAWMRANGDRVTMGTPGIGSASHISSFEFLRRTGSTAQIAHYRGGAPAKQDMLAGTIQVMIDLAGNSLPQIQSGEARAYAVTSRTRMAAAPDVPTTAEAGLPDFYMSVWHGIWAPRDTPAPVVQRLNGAIRAALENGEVRRLLAGMGQEIPAVDQLSPEALGALQRREIETWSPVIRAAGIRPE